jgi:Cytochrome c oxidase subunit IV
VKVEWRTILGASVFLGATGLVYWALKNHPTEAAGVTMLIFGFAAYGMLFSYLLLQYFRRNKIPRPEDRFDATYADGEGEVGYFPSASMWPAGMGLGMIFAVIGLIYGLWYLIIGAILFFGAVIGWMTEAEAATEVPDTMEDEEAAEAAGHPGHLEAHPDLVEGPVPGSSSPPAAAAAPAPNPAPTPTAEDH